MFTLTRSETSIEDAAAERHQWPVRFDARYSDGGEPAKIFVMHKAPADGIFADTLSCVASAIQMTDLPEDEPGPGSPFYRVASFTKLCRSADAANELVEKIRDAVQDLADNLAAADTLSEVEEFTITPSN